MCCRRCLTSCNVILHLHGSVNFYVRPLTALLCVCLSSFRAHCAPCGRASVRAGGRGGAEDVQRGYAHSPGVQSFADATRVHVRARANRARPRAHSQGHACVLRQWWLVVCFSALQMTSFEWDDTVSVHMFEHTGTRGATACALTHVTSNSASLHSPSIAVCVRPCAAGQPVSSRPDTALASFDPFPTADAGATRHAHQGATQQGTKATAGSGAGSDSCTRGSETPCPRTESGGNSAGSRTAPPPEDAEQAAYIARLEARLAAVRGEAGGARSWAGNGNGFRAEAAHWASWARALRANNDASASRAAADVSRHADAASFPASAPYPSVHDARGAPVHEAASPAAMWASVGRAAAASATCNAASSSHATAWRAPYRGATASHESASLLSGGEADGDTLRARNEAQEEGADAYSALNAAASPRSTHAHPVPALPVPERRVQSHWTTSLCARLYQWFCGTMHAWLRRPRPVQRLATT